MHQIKTACACCFRDCNVLSPRRSRRRSLNPRRQRAEHDADAHRARNDTFARTAQTYSEETLRSLCVTIIKGALSTTTQNVVPSLRSLRQWRSSREHMAALHVQYSYVLRWQRHHNNKLAIALWLASPRSVY